MKKLKFLQGKNNLQAERQHFDYPGVSFSAVRAKAQKSGPLLTTLQPLVVSRRAAMQRKRDGANSLCKVWKDPNETRDAWSPTCKQLSQRIATIYKKSDRKTAAKGTRPIPSILQDVTIDRLRLHTPMERKHLSRRRSLKQYLQEGTPTFTQFPRQNKLSRSVVERPYASVRLESLRPWTRDGRQLQHEQ